MKKIILVVSAILLTGLIGFGLPKLIEQPANTIQVDQAELKVQVQEQFIEDLTQAYEENALEVQKEEAAKDQTVEEAALPTTEPVTGTEAPGTTDAPVTTEGTAPATGDAAVTPDPVTTGTNEEVDIADDGATPAGATEEGNSGAQVKDAWVQDQINENIDQISEADLAAGAAIYNKLDTGYLFGLADGGLTDAEKSEVQAYLEENLPPEEIDLAMALYNKYVYLLN